VSARLRLVFVSALVAAFGVLTAAYAATGRFALDETGAPRALAAAATPASSPAPPAPAK
jgi:hypothetical protein